MYGSQLIALIFSGDILTKVSSLGGEMVECITPKSSTTVIRQWRSNYHGAGKFIIVNFSIFIFLLLLVYKSYNKLILPDLAD